jgi:hypothetical protein
LFLVTLTAPVIFLEFKAKGIDFLCLDEAYDMPANKKLTTVKNIILNNITRFSNFFILFDIPLFKKIFGTLLNMAHFFMFFIIYILLNHINRALNKFAFRIKFISGLKPCNDRLSSPMPYSALPFIK